MGYAGKYIFLLTFFLLDNFLFKCTRNNLQCVVIFVDPSITLWCIQCRKVKAFNDGGEGE